MVMAFSAVELMKNFSEHKSRVAQGQGHIYRELPIMIRLGVIGYGQRINGIITSMREIDPNIRVAGIVDPHEVEVRARLAECDQKDVVFYENLGDMVSTANLDALAIGTQCNLHTPYAIQAAQYDLPLFLEKPVSTSKEQALSLERAFETAKSEVVVSFPLRVSSLCTLAHERISKGAVGTPEHIHVVNYVPYGTCYFDTAAYRDYHVSQGLFLQKATHDFDYMSYLMSSNITRVAAMHSRGRVFGGTKEAGLVCSQCKEADTCLESPHNRKRNSSGGHTTDHLCLFGKDLGSLGSGMNEDSSSALVEFASGAQGVYTQVFYSRRDAETRGPIISGYNGTLSFDWYTKELKVIHHHTPFTETIRAGAEESHFGGDIELGRDFINIITCKGTSRTPIESGIQSVYACLAAKESAETGRFIDVRQVGA
jgi:predicted dehydrogenase